MDPFEPDSLWKHGDKRKQNWLFLFLVFFCLLALFAFIISILTRYQMSLPSIHPVCACKELMSEHNPHVDQTQYTLSDLSITPPIVVS